MVQFYHTYYIFTVQFVFNPSHRYHVQMLEIPLILLVRSHWIGYRPICLPKTTLRSAIIMIDPSGAIRILLTDQNPSQSSFEIKPIF